MKIYNKTIAILGICFLFLFLATSAITHTIFMTHNMQLENTVLQDNTQRVQHAFENELDHINMNTYDWAAWDDTYDFIQDGNSEYIETNIHSINTPLSLGINFMLFYDNEGNLVHGIACDLDNKEEISLSPEIIEEIADSTLLSHPSTESSTSGIIELSDSLFLVASRPIIKSNYEGPIQGTLINGRFLDESFIESIEEKTLISIELHELEGTNLPADYAANKNEVLTKGYAHAVDKENDLANAYFFIEDINGEPLLILKTEMERTIYREGLSTITNTFYLTIFVLVITALLILYILKKDLISRITSLRNDIIEIDLKADINSRLDIAGEDEITDLTENINSMLDSLQEKNAIFKSTVESVEYGFVAYDKNGKVLFINQQLLTIYKLPPEMIDEKNGYKILDAALQKIESSEELENEIEKRKYSPDSSRIISKLKDGRTVESYSLPLIVNNEVYGNLCAHNDITGIVQREKELKNEIERREDVENKLQLSEEKFSKIATSANDAIIMVDNEGRTIFWNNAATEIFGYSEDEVLGRKIHNIIAPEKYSPEYKYGFTNFTKGGLGAAVGKTIELDGKRKNGTEFPIELSLSSMQLSDGTWNAAAIIRDITERRRLDEIEHELLERLTTIINNINSGIMLIDRENKTITDINPVAADMIGLPRDEIIGNNCHRFVCLADKNMCPIIDLNQTVDKSEKVLLDKDGNEIPVIKSVVTVKLRGKEYLVESFYDISNIKKVEEALIDAKLAAEASNIAKSQFLANMSHELRTPLNSIIGFSDILLYNGTNVSSDKRQKYLSNISNSGKHLLEVINDVLDLSKIEAGKMELVIEDFNIFEALDEVNRTLMPLAEKKNISFEFTTDERISVVKADRLKIKQILYNLIGNAIKFTLDDGNIHIFVRKAMDNMEIEVKDSGIGIHPDELQNMFHPFKQVDSALNRNYEGSGLGLTIVKNYVEMHGGNIHVKSEPDKGSSFIFAIPLN